MEARQMGDSYEIKIQMSQMAEAKHGFSLGINSYRGNFKKGVLFSTLPQRKRETAKHGKRATLFSVENGRPFWKQPSTAG